MNVKNIHQDKNKCSFTIEGISPHYANTLRRTMIDLVPTLAIELVEFRKNSSAMYDEVFAHRLALVPLVTDSTYEYKEERVEGDPTTEVVLTLEAKGPCTVYASDLKSKDPKVKPVYPKTPIVTLLESQEVSLEATAVVGIGKEHAKWSPGLVWFNYEPKVKVDSSFKDLDKVKPLYPKQIFDGNKISAKKIEELNLYDAVDGVSPAVEVSYDKNNMIFHLESWGQLSCNEIVQKAFVQLDKQLDELKKLAKVL